MMTIFLSMGLLLAVACSPAESEPAPAADANRDTNDAATSGLVEEPMDEELGDAATSGLVEEPNQDSEELLPLPAISNDSSGGLGGGITTESLSEPAVGTSMLAIDPFLDTVFALDVSLPVEPTEAVVWRQPGRTLTDELAADMASKFGFTGPIYREALMEAEEAGEMQLELARPGGVMPIFAFNGDEQLVITANGVFYSDNGVEVEFPSQIESAVAISTAEAFLQERGLLTFDYTVEEDYPGQVVFKRLINGEPSNLPEIYVTLNSAAEIQYVSYEVLSELSNLGSYPLISAQEAWDLLQTGEIFANNIPYEFQSNDEGEFTFEEDPFFEQYQFWVREYQPGDVVELYSYPQIFEPVVEGNAPIVRANNYNISASTDVLNGMLSAVGRQTKFVGTLANDGQTIVLSDWEQLESNDPLYLEGEIAAGDDGSTLLNTIDGVTYTIPNAPADLEAGLNVYVFAWSEVETAGAYMALNWESIEKQVERQFLEEPIVAEPLPADGDMAEPMGYESVTITEITLGYYTTYQYETVGGDAIVTDETPGVVVQPVWRFTGSVTGGPADVETITFFVQAVDPALLGDSE